MRDSTLRRALLLVLAALLFGAACPAPVLAASPRSPIPITDYWELVESSRQAVAELKGAAPEKIQTGLDELLAQWEAVTEVRLENGDVIPLDNSFVISALRAEEPDLDRLTGIFDALLAARRDYPAAQFTANDIQPLNEILSRPEFQWKEQEPNPINEWFQESQSAEFPQR